MALNLRKQSGFTLVEVTIILLVLTILSTIMLPQLGNFNRLARFVKVKEDLGALCSSIDKLLKETMLSGFWTNPRYMGGRISLLVGPGKRPAEGAPTHGDTFKGPGGAVNGTCNWRDQVGTECHVATDRWKTKVHFVVDTLENHLQQNNPGGDDRDNYPNAIDDPLQHAGPGRGQQGAGSFFGWREPYFDWLTADPWGQSYLVNTFALLGPKRSKHPNDVFTSAVVCYSAGIDGAVDTHFNQPINDDDMDGFFGWQFGDDDIGAILSGGGPF